MKVLVLNNAAPFIRGGAEELADCLVQRLNETNGVEAELFAFHFVGSQRSGSSTKSCSTATCGSITSTAQSH